MDFLRGFVPSCEPISSARGLLFSEGQDGFDHFFHRDVLHAAEVDRAFAQEAGAALGFLADHDAARAARAGEGWLGGAEQRGERGSDEIGEVHRAGVIRHQACDFR